MIRKLQNIAVEEKLKAMGLEVFTPQEFQGVFEVSKKSASMFILNNTKNGLLVKLRNNFYALKDNRPDYSFIANKLYQPSYISLETALSHYGIIPEVVYGNSSVTTKTPREFSTPLGRFSYRHVKTEVFTGYQLRVVDQNKVLFAEPEKALADYLYFVDLKKLVLNDRLNLKDINKSKLIEYANLYKRPNMLKLINQIYAHAREPRKIY